MKNLKLTTIPKHLILFIIGGFIYYGMEVVWRGYSHWTMFLLGGICFVALGLLNEKFTFLTPLWKQMFVGAGLIIILEFIVGCIVNLLLGWNVWDYSELPLNILGQVCLSFSILWVFIALVGIVLDDFLRHWLFGEEKPHYTWF